MGTNTSSMPGSVDNSFQGSEHNARGSAVVGAIAHTQFDASTLSASFDTNGSVMVFGLFDNALDVPVYGQQARCVMALLTPYGNLLPAQYYIVSVPGGFVGETRSNCAFDPANNRFVAWGGVMSSGSGFMIGAFPNSGTISGEIACPMWASDVFGNVTPVGNLTGSTIGLSDAGILVENTGNILVPSNTFAFSSWNGNAVTGLIRVDRNGSFLFNFPFSTYTIASFVSKGPSQETYILAGFGAGATYGGIAMQSLTFLWLTSSDVMSVTWRDQGSGFNQTPECMANDGSFFLFGAPGLTYNGSTTQQGIIRCGYSGVIDSSFVLYFSSSGYQEISQIIPQTVSGSQRYIIVGIEPSGTPFINRSLNNGTLDTSFNAASSPSGSTLNVSVSPVTGYLYLTGSFPSINGTARGHFAILDANGNLQ